MYLDDMPGDHPRLVLLCTGWKEEMNVELHNYYQRDHNLRLDREIRYLSAIISILNIRCLLNFVGLDIGYGLLRWFLYQNDL